MKLFGQEWDWKTGLHLWWARTWRAFLIGFGINFAMNIIYMMSAMQWPPQKGAPPPEIPLELQLFQLAINFFIAYLVLGIVFQRRYSIFSVEVCDNATNEPITMTHKQQVQLWWSLTWREWVSGIALMAVLIPVGLLVGVVFTAIDVSKWLMFLVGFAGGLWAALYTMGHVYAIIGQKRFKDFHVVITTGLNP